LNRTTLAVCRYAEELANVLWRIKKLLRIALPRLNLPRHYSRHSLTASSYFLGSFCTMRNSWLQCWHVAVVKRIVLPGQRYRVCFSQCGHRNSCLSKPGPICGTWFQWGASDRIPNARLRRL